MTNQIKIWRQPENGGKEVTEITELRYFTVVAKPLFWL